MPREYIPNPGGKVYRKPDLDVIQRAREDVDNHGVSIRQASKKYGIPYTVLQRHLKGKVKYIGGQTVLSEHGEKLLVVCAEWGYPLDFYGLRLIFKSYLDNRGKIIAIFKDNLPGREFEVGFMKCHKEIISERFCQNIKRARASISTSTVNEYFDNLAESIRDVPGSHIVNFDETNLTNDPGPTKIVTKRGCKYPERVVNQSKSAVSIMFAASASGELLPCYVVYKSKHLYTTWTEGAPKGTRFNCTQSGWFDGFTFEDWVKHVALPYFKDEEGNKILIGDNLSSHLSCEAIRVCQENDIHFVFLPSNSTHLTQPLDVAFFRPLKVAWRKVLLKWKLGLGMREPSLPKDVFPRLLTKLLQQIELNAVENIKSGFEKSGIMPLNRKKVLDMLPGTEDKEGVEKAMQDSFKTLLYNMRDGDSGTGTQPKRSRKKIPVEAGKSVQCPIPVSDEDYEPEVPEEAYSENTQDVAFPEKRNNTADDSFSDGSIESQELEESKVTKFGRTFNNIEPVSEDDIHVKDWVLVGFAAETGSKPGPSKLLYYIGQVVQKLDCETFEASFLRFKQTRDFSGHIYAFPAV